MNTSKVLFLANLCGIKIYPLISRIHKLDDYATIHNKYKLEPSLLQILYDYGCLMHYRFNVMRAKQSEFDKQDIDYSTAIEHVEVLQTLLFGKDIHIDIKDGIGDVHKLRYPSVLHLSIIDNTITHTITELDNEGFLQLDDPSIFHLLQKYDFFDDWSAKNNSFNNYLELTEKFKEDFDVKQISGREDISPKYLDLLLYIAKRHNERIFGNEKKRINPALGDDYLKNARQSQCHVVIQKLSLILRLEGFLTSKSCYDIKDITLTNKHCEFIYDYLNFFGIYYFGKEKSSQDKSFTSSKDKLIRSCYRSFFSSKINKIQQEEIIPIIDNINNYKIRTEI